ncbi:MAG: peptide-methionine (S)-S-oxide reductase MsrA [Gammaproteobacteria bacterium]|nr:peptide-methionine (S)-S-oxide reductase MsrA [Gammaproteobacteria bacterium]
MKPLLSLALSFMFLIINNHSLATEKNKEDTVVAYFAGGCFWGVEYYFEKQKGVIDAVSGYMGGNKEYPSYHDVSYKNTGHIEVVAVEYNAKEVDYETLARLFFEIHDPTQVDGQGPDIGEQYLSVAFYNHEKEKKILHKLISLLKKNNYEVATTVRPVKTFWVAEKYHQDYYVKKNGTPYCHAYTKRF